MQVCLDDWLYENNPVRVIEAFVDMLDLAELGLAGVGPADTGWAAYHPCGAFLRLLQRPPSTMPPEHLSATVTRVPPAALSDSGSNPGAGWSPAPAIRFSICLHAVATISAVGFPPSWPWMLSVVGLNHLVLAGLGMCPRSCLLGPNLTRLPGPSARRGEVALTFDDGPDPRITPSVLDLLDSHGARAAFFCIGSRANAYPDPHPHRPRRYRSALPPYSDCDHPSARMNKKLCSKPQDSGR